MQAPDISINELIGGDKAMKQTEFNKKQVIIYLIATFVVAWIIQGVASYLALHGHTIAYTLVLSASMFAPLLGVLLSGYKLKNIGWKPRFKGNLKVILIAWFSPVLLTALGALLYFLVFPSHFDLSGQYLIATAGEEALQQLKAQGLSYPVYVLITVISCLTYAPAINAITAIGEEAGWRGFLYPQLKERFSKRVALILGGVIWGLWHAPIIWLIGYEYGMEYFGYPVVGILTFCIITIALGIICDWTYEKSGCIFWPAIFHGSYNAAAVIPIMLSSSFSGSERLLGAASNGLLAGLPFILFAIFLLVRSGKDEDEPTAVKENNIIDTVIEEQQT